MASIRGLLPAGRQLALPQLPPPPSWRALGYYWLAVLALLAGGAASLAWLGPPEAPVLAGGPLATSTTPPVQPETGLAATAVATAPVDAAPPSSGGNTQAPAALDMMSAPPASASAPPAAPELADIAATPPVSTTAPQPAAPAPGTVAALPQPATPSPGTVAAVPQPATPAPGAVAVAPPLATTSAGPAAPASPLAVPSPPGGAVAPAAPPPPALADAAEPRPTVADPPIRPVDRALLEAGPHGPLPRIAADGRTPIRTYARAFDRQDPRPKIGLIIGGLGLNAAISEEAIRRLPGGIALAFSPYAPQLPAQLERARARGMETLIALPLEPASARDRLDNAGDRALLTGLSMAENEDRLAWALSRFGGYVGAIGALGPMRGERYAAMSERFGPLQESLARRGLLYIDPRPGAANPVHAWGRAIDLVIDEPATRGEIERKLAALEQLGRDRGSALGYAGGATPVLIERLAAWSGDTAGSGLERRGLVLAPVTALIRRPEAAAEAAPAAPVAATPARNR